MHWAKTSSGAKFNLAMSGMPNLKLRELRVSLDDLEITDGGYGYQPLMQAIAERYRVATDCVVTAAGTTFANHLAMAALIKPGACCVPLSRREREALFPQVRKRFSDLDR
jgi:hypothetical protein